ncbi:MAG TPA: glycosyltransferase family 39 protein [Candidatus Angelobacter sp.]|nr:glycosyltransferase family 39 protein [Candidatus Angelobacter sp.]
MPAQTAPQHAIRRPTSSASAPRRRAFLLLIVAAWIAVYAGSLFQPPLLDDADTVHAEAAREMVQVDHDWVTLHINNGFRYLEKAPLMYWCVAASFKLFGVHDWSARLPIALGVLALLLVVYRLGTRVYGEEGGFYSALVLVTGFGPFIFTRILIPDMGVALWLALGFDLFLTTLEQADGGQRPSPWLSWGIAATMALNVLTKGLIGLVFPVGTIFFFLLLTGNLRHLLKLRLFSGLLVFLALAAPWHLLAGWRNPAQGQARGFFWFYFVNEHFLRYINKRFPADYDTVPLWLFWGLMLIWLMPWTAFMIQALRQIPIRLRVLRSGLSNQQQGTLLFAIWMLVVLVFFSFSSRQEYYVIAGIPGLALLLGGWLARETTSPLGGPERRSGRISSLVLSIIGMTACLAAVMLALMSRVPPPNYDIAELLRKNPQDYELSFGHFLDLTPRAMGAFRVPLLVTGLALALGTFFNLLLRIRNRTLLANLVLALMMVVVLREAHVGLLIFSPVLTSQPLVETIESHWKPGSVIEDNGDYEAASSINFYTGRQMRILNGQRNNIWYGSRFPDAPPIFDSDESFRKLWGSQRRIFLATDEDSIPGTVKNAGYCQLAKWGGKLILTNELKLCRAPALPP